ncbi:hypothetical protein CC2G_000128 [Coprinopsis cinerea AmutBmut pab1-1]|nr:hypothetical protein CC2G_000128 [Coprinopsis cinerea AmutBmut pab1-1]
MAKSSVRIMEANKAVETYGDLMSLYHLTSTRERKPGLRTPFLVEAKASRAALWEHIPQVVAQSIASMCMNNRLGEEVTAMNWVLSDGIRWLFGTTSKATGKYTCEYAVAGEFNLNLSQDAFNVDDTTCKALLQLLEFWVIGDPKIVHEVVLTGLAQRESG